LLGLRSVPWLSLLALTVKNEDGLNQRGRLLQQGIGREDRADGTVLAALPDGFQAVVDVLNGGGEDGPQCHQVGSDGLEVRLR
jgi:hypothetical protein